MSDSNDPPPPSPYGQPPFPPADNPYGGQPQQPQYGGVPAYNLPAGYGRPVDPNKRPGTVTAAGVVTLVLSGISLLLFAAGAIGLAVARDDVVDNLKDEQAFDNISPDDLVSILIVFVLVFVVWCIAAMVLAVFAMRRSNVARILLVVSAGMAALISLLSITSLISGITLLGSVGVIVLLFVGGASEWYAHKDGPASELPVGTTQPWG